MPPFVSSAYEPADHSPSIIKARSQFLLLVAELRPQIIEDLFECASEAFENLYQLNSVQDDGLGEQLEPLATLSLELLCPSQTVRESLSERALAIVDSQEAKAVVKAIKSWGETSRLKEDWCLEHALRSLALKRWWKHLRNSLWVWREVATQMSVYAETGLRDPQDVRKRQIEIAQSTHQPLDPDFPFEMMPRAQLPIPQELSIKKPTPPKGYPPVTKVDKQVYLERVQKWTNFHLDSLGLSKNDKQEKKLCEKILALRMRKATDYFNKYLGFLARCGWQPTPKRERFEEDLKLTIRMLIRPTDDWKKIAKEEKESVGTLQTRVRRILKLLDLSNNLVFKEHRQSPKPKRDGISSLRKQRK